MAHKVILKIQLERLLMYADECIREYQCKFKKGKLTLN